MELLILLLLIALNGVLVLSEMAIVASRKARLQQLADEGRPGASTALALANDPGPFLSTTQIGITVIGIASGAFAAETVARRLAGFLARFAVLEPHAATLALVIVVTGITVGSLVLGELVPKRIALLHPEATASAIARPMRFLLWLVFPLVNAISVATEAVLRLFGSPAHAAPPISQEEIRVLMRQGTAAGVFDQNEQAMVARVFRMDERRVTSAMTPRTEIRFLDLELPFETNRATLLQSPHSRFPLCKGGLGTIVGIVRAKGLLDSALQGRPFDLVPDAGQPLYVPESLTLTDVLEAFRQHRSHLALVVDEYGDIQGLVTLANVMQALVGEIGSVEQSGDSPIVRRDDGSWLVEGALTVQRLHETSGLETAVPVSDDEYNTLAGFVLANLRRMPRAGDRFDAGSYRFEVIDMDHQRVDKVLISQLPRAGGASPARTSG
jgi:putative hemolysin